MKTTMSTATVSVASVRQGSSAVASGGGDSGFSRVLSGVYAAQGATQGATPKAQSETRVGSQAERSGARDALSKTREAQGATPTTEPVRKEEVGFSDPSGAAAITESAGGEANVTTLGAEKAPGEAAGALVGTDETAVKPEDAALGDLFLSLSSKEYGAVGVRMEAQLRELIVTLSNGNDDDEEGKIIDALLRFLKERQEAEDGDAAISLAMQLLTVMLGGQAEQSTMRLSVRDISVEMSAISGVYREETAQTSAEDFPTDPAFSEGARGEDSEVGEIGDETASPEIGASFAEAAKDQPEPTDEGAKPETKELEPAQTPEEAIPNGRADENLPEVKPLGEAVTPTTETTASETVIREAQIEAPIAYAAESATPQQRGQTRASEQAIPGTAEERLNEILDRAREELGLTKAELTQVPEKREERTRSILPKAQTQSPEGKEAENGAEEAPTRAMNPTARELALSPNHKDGRGELDRILNGGETDERKEQFTGAETNAAATPQRAEIGEIELPKESEARAETLSPERQLTDELLARSETFEGGRSEFTMVLNPESLGKITVRLISTGGRVQVNIAAENDATRQLLAAREDQIGSALKSNGVELERYQVVSGREEAQLMQDSYDGSSKNPYGQQDERSEEREDDGEDFLEILQQL
ncbi:MAG: flagellar hook-length control protein FliK [Bacteroides sp.]|nr:flagellar hook-length control protein FliK [Eubacterium sp.]MCM1419461.1 flagellar hook-length control protein FliK [Roseburia sp.]MCM1463321.1 flagellar hook-length control protein FliK [Bacteroides sp.]